MWQGLLEVTVDGLVKTLTDEAEGVKFKLTDGVDVARDGLIYFTDASYKYKLKEHLMDILEGRPYGRVLSFDPSTKETKVLVRDLFFPNGVVVSPDQNSLIFCETVMYVFLSLSLSFIYSFFSKRIYKTHLNHELFYILFSIVTKNELFHILC